MRVLPQHLLPQTTTIVAKWDEKVIATFSLIRDNPLGLPMEKIFDLTSRRRGGRRLTEGSSLAIDPHFRGKISMVLFPIFRFAYQYARRCFGTHEFVCAVNPSTVDMYLALMCFERLENTTKTYDFVKGAPAVGLFQNFDNLDNRFKQLFGHLPLHSNFHKYWTEDPNDPRNCLPERELRKAADPALTPELLREFFMEKAQLKNSLTLNEMQTLLNAYPYPSFQEVIYSALKARFRNGVRMDVQMTAQLRESSVKNEVWNVSKEGLLIATKHEALAINQKVNIVVWLNDSQSIRLTCEVHWHTADGLCGLRILAPSIQWLDMIRKLELPYILLTKETKEAA